MAELVLAIDIGNSTTTIALFGPDGKPAFRSDTATRRNTTRDQFAIVLKGIFDLYHADLTAIGGAGHLQCGALCDSCR